MWLRSTVCLTWFGVASSSRECMHPSRTAQTFMLPSAILSCRAAPPTYHAAQPTYSLHKCLPPPTARAELAAPGWLCLAAWAGWLSAAVLLPCWLAGWLALALLQAASRPTCKVGWLAVARLLQSPFPLCFTVF